MIPGRVDASVDESLYGIVIKFSAAE